MTEPRRRDDFFRAWRDGVPYADVERGRARFLEALPLRSAHTRRRSVVFALAAAALVASLSLIAWWRTPAALRFTTPQGEGSTGAWLATDAARELPLRFSEGTEVVMAPESRGRVEQLGRAGATFLLERGELHAHVVHRAQTDWLFRAGPFEVQVTGTSLGVEWDPLRERFSVKVDEGSVVVRGPEVGGSRVVRTGERCVVDLPSRTVRSSRPEPAGAADAMAPAVDADGAATRSADAVRVPLVRPSQTHVSRGWIALEEKADYDGAYAEAKGAGFASVIRASTPDELLRLAQVARLSGHPEAYREVLLACRQRFPGTETAAVAAYELGRASPSSDAAAWFDAYLKEEPSGPLVREALGRVVEAKASAGDAPGARDVATTYLARYPDGPHAPLARRVLAGGRE